MTGAVQGLITNRRIVYAMQPKQEVASNTMKPYRLFGGAKGGGKSYWLRGESARQANSAPGISGLVLRRTFPEVEKNFLYPFMREYPTSGYRYNGQNHIIKFANGSTIELGFCRNMQDVLRYQGIEYDFIGIEEITNWEEDEFDMIISSLRSTKEGVTPNFFCTGNPGGRGHGWVKKRWITREPSKNNESYDISEYAFIGAKYTDNLILMKSDPNYVKRLNALPEKIRRAYRDGDWDIFEGQYFEEFRKDLHVIPHEYPRNAKKRWISLDYGYAAPASVHWHAQLSDGTVITYRELYVTKHTYRQLAVKILAMTGESEMEEIDGQVFADPSIFSKENESTATTAFEDMMEEGLVIQKAKNKRVPGWMHMRQGMQAYEDPNTGEITSRWKITEACPNLIRTLPAMIHDAKNVEDLDTKLEDHAPDSARYGLVEIKWEEIDEEFLVTANQAMLKKNVQNNPISINSGQRIKPNIRREEPEDLGDEENDGWDDEDTTLLNKNF